MIYTVTFNPSLDYVVKVQDMKPGTVNRTETEYLYPGGKGINVSILLHHLGFTSQVLGFIAGFTGDEIERMLQKVGCQTNFIRTKGLSRINVKIKSAEETEINGQGIQIAAEDLQQLYDQLDQLQADDYIVLAGSIPNHLPENIYETILKRLQGKNIKVVVDATKNLLKNVLKYQPFLIKPNKHELGELFAHEAESRAELLAQAKQLQTAGARNVLVSLAGEGALLLTEEQMVYESASPQGVLVNSVGSGDSMVAGFLSGYLKTGSYEEAFRYGIAAGSASAFEEWLATKEQVENVLSQMPAIVKKAV